MTVSELRAALNDLDPDMPVLLATQPRWPMLYELSPDAVVLEGAVYLAEQTQLGYLSHDVANELGW